MNNVQLISTEAIRSSTDIRCIGTTKGPGESAHEYTFVTPDVERWVKTGEFVYYETRVEGQTRQILGRVTDRVPLRYVFRSKYLCFDPTPYLIGIRQTAQSTR